MDVTHLAQGLNLSVIGVSRVDGDNAHWPAEARLRQFIAEGRHGDMDWMELHLERRAHPRMLWPQAKSAIVAGLSYAPDHDPLEHLEHTDRGAISVYAHGKDYHDLFKKRLKRLATRLADHSGEDVKVFVDTAPLMEKPLAALAGVGWQGKHTNLVSRNYGSWLFLGVILTTAELEPDQPEDDHCGSCRRCLDVCPTNAFPAPYQLDARRCLAYLSIEHKGPIPLEFRKPMGNRIYGCDDCLAVCPWNKFAEATAEAAFQPRATAALPELAELVALDDQTFRSRFAGSPIKRTGRDRFVRNVLIAIGNSADQTLLPHAERLLDDHNDLVRGAAIWAVCQLASENCFANHYHARRSTERVQHVQAEWDQAWAQLSRSQTDVLR